MQNIYLEIKGPDVKGEATTEQGKDKIELLSWSQSLSMPMHSRRSSESVKHGRADFTDFTVSKYLDKTSPILLQATAGGTNYKTMTVSIFKEAKDTGKAIEYYTVDLSEVVISSMSIGHGGGDTPVETLTFNFDKIKWTYTAEKSSSEPGGKVPGTWDLEKNTK
jgi:type VI secretion system secreted protein Hcp